MFGDNDYDLSYNQLAPQQQSRAAAPPPMPPMGSPDGLGEAHVAMTALPSAGFGAADPAMGAMLTFIEPNGVSPQAAVRSAGFTALGASVAFGLGLAAGGPWGGVAGILFSGSLFNLNRAQKWWSSRDPSEKHEAVVSGVMGALTLAFGGYSAYKAYKSKE